MAIALASGPGSGAPHLACRVLLLSRQHATLRDWQVILARLGPGPIATASSVLDAFNQIARDRPGLVLADAAMPVPNGLALARELRQSPFTDRRTLVALVGPGAAGFDPRQAKAASIDQFVPGPLDATSAQTLLAAAGLANPAPSHRPSLAQAIDTATALVQAWAVAGDEALLGEVIASIATAQQLAAPPAAVALERALSVAEWAAASWDVNPDAVLNALAAARACA